MTAEVAFLPRTIIFPSVGLQPLGVRTQPRLERLGEIAGGHALEVRPLRQLFDRFHFAQIPWQDAGRERGMTKKTTERIRFGRPEMFDEFIT